MFTEQTQQITYSWQEFGEIVRVLADSIEESGLITRIAPSNRQSTDDFILAQIVAARLDVDFDWLTSDGFKVGINNLSGEPDAVITKYTHSQEEFQYFEPAIFYDVSTVDEEHRIQKVVLPW